MKTKGLLFIVFMLFANAVLAQTYFIQYFDGVVPGYSAIEIMFEGDSTNIWQIGPPQKTIFDSAATQPNALLTDTINYYPTNDTSSFKFTINHGLFWYGGVLAIQWKQKLDMDSGFDGGKIEFSIDGEQTWQNAFNNPNVYNFYGFLDENRDTLPNGDFVFSGTDSTWRDVWLCYDIDWMNSQMDSMVIRYTFMSDSVDNSKEGWLIDNLIVHHTFQHTISERKLEKYINVYPNPTNDIIHIEIEKSKDFHIIENMMLINSLGQIVESWNYIPTKYWFSTKKYTNGKYYLQIKTNKQSETIPFVIHHR